MEIEISHEIEEKLNGIAKDANLPLEKALEFILSEFVRNPGGRIYVGTWKSGGDGRRIVVQWPFLTGFIKIHGDEIKKFGGG
ncbi:MAG: hypothetical protein ACE5K0_06780 [Candidatus Methanofastidiosia archaeon]